MIITRTRLPVSGGTDRTDFILEKISNVFFVSEIDWKWDSNCDGFTSVIVIYEKFEAIEKAVHRLNHRMKEWEITPRFVK